MKKLFEEHYLPITLTIAGATAVMYIFGMPFGITKLNVYGKNILYIVNMFLLILLSVGLMKLLFPQWHFGWSGEGIPKKLLLHGSEGVIGAFLVGFFSFKAFKPLTADPDIGKIIIWVFIYYLFVALIEEVFMRGILLNALIRKLGKDKKGIVAAILISSIIFGLGHLPGMMQFKLLIAVQRFLWTICLGVYLGCIYVITRNLWITIILHYLIDVAGGLFYYYSENDELLGDTTMNLGICLVLGLLGMIRVLVVVRGKQYSLTEH